MVVLSNFPPPTEGIKLQQPLTSVHLKNKDIGKGTLYITESRLSWVNNASGQGFSLEYPHIALHAVSRDLRAYPHECIYVMIDAQVDEEENKPQDNNEDDDEDEESDSGMTEMRLIPEDKGMLDAIFHAMSECQALHPDPQDSLSDGDDVYEDADEDHGEYDLDGGEAQIIEHVGNHHATMNGDEPMDVDAGQFEDAENEPEN